MPENSWWFLKSVTLIFSIGIVWVMLRKRYFSSDVKWKLDLGQRDDALDLDV